MLEVVSNSFGTGRMILAAVCLRCSNMGPNQAARNCGHVAALQRRLETILAIGHLDYGEGNLK
ncbi:MAG TPA: hypothetical protein VFO20_09395 [Propionibacteriaceae bacterium]|nr:hypothetical protein [Propionibacteriaceae bacterium]HEX5906366.1 hypothetical protein [Propionibacteriaceae bacterium]